MIREASKDITDTDVEKVESIFQELRTNFLDGRTQDLAFRKSMLKTLLRGVNEMEKEFLQAIY